MKRLLTGATILAALLVPVHAAPVLGGGFDTSYDTDQVTSQVPAKNYLLTQIPVYATGFGADAGGNLTGQGSITGQYDGLILGINGTANGSDVAVFRSALGAQGVLTSDTLATIAAGNTYKLSIDIGGEVGLYDSAPPVGDVTLELLVNNAVVASNLATSSTLPASTFDAHGNRLTYSVATYSVTLTAADIQSLNLSGALSFKALGEVDPTGNVAYQNDFDNVDLSITPEPSTWAMLFGGFGALLLVQRLRRTRQS